MNKSCISSQSKLWSAEGRKQTQGWDRKYWEGCTRYFMVSETKSEMTGKATEEQTGKFCKLLYSLNI